MNESLEIRRKRLLYQSAHRGTKESDLLLGAFAAAYLAGFTPGQLDQFEHLLAENDAVLFDWITGRRTPPSGSDSEVLRLLLSFRYPGAA